MIARSCVVDVLPLPLPALAVLGHLQAGHRHAAGVGRLARPVQDSGREEQLDALGGGRHVGALGDGDDPVAEQVGGVLAVDLVLGGARERAVGRHFHSGL